MIPGLALFLGMLHIMEDQDTVKKVDQGSKTQLLFFQVSNHLCTQRMTISFFFTSSALPSLTENVDLFVNHHVFLDYSWICLIVAHSEKKIRKLFRRVPMSK